jgi:diphthamide biosynthesis enzyme Dph1/Dph2-like protein
MEKQYNFDVKGALDLLLKYEFERVVLQFSDEYLSVSVSIYDYFTTNLPDTLDVFITADSTFGSSVDDISALHINSDVIVYFGNEMSHSDIIPIIILPFQKPIHFPHFINKIQKCFVSSDIQSIIKSKNNIVLISEPSYYHLLSDLHRSLSNVLDLDMYTVIEAKVFNNANLSIWSPANAVSQDGDMESIASMLIPKNTLHSPYENSIEDNNLILFIGDKESQLNNILLQHSNIPVIQYTPINIDIKMNDVDNVHITDTDDRSHSNEIKVYYGNQMKLFNERYFNVIKIQQSKVIGILIASMSVSSNVIKNNLSMLQQLIQRSGRYSYCFVMGRINDSKLCNFPEVIYTNIY